MENLLHELTEGQGDGDGVVVWFLEALWRGKSERQEKASQYHQYFPTICPSVILYFSRIRAWYFNPKMASNGLGAPLPESHSSPQGKVHAVKKKRQQNLVCNEVIRSFCELGSKPSGSSNNRPASASPHLASPTGLPPSTSWSKYDDADKRKKGKIPTGLTGQLHRRQEHTIVAQAVSKHPSGTPSIIYLTRRELEEYLLRGTLETTSLLLQFSPPKSGNPFECRNSNFLVRWQHSYIYVERHSNLNLLNDASKSSQERGETVEGTRNTRSVAVSTGVVVDRLKDICNCLAEHLFLVAGLRVKELHLVFKVDAQDHLVLQWCQKLSLTDREVLRGMKQAIPTEQRRGESQTHGDSSMLLLEGSVRSTSPSARDQPSTFHASSQNSSRMDSSQRPEDKMLREADTSFRRLSTTGVRRPRAGALRGKARSMRLLSTVYGVRQSIVELANPQNLMTYVFNPSDQKVGEATEIIDDMAWGKPSQVDQAILKKAKSGPYAVSHLAQDSGRFGLRDLYLATMHSPLSNQAIGSPARK
jgi:hypothetical protein